MLQGGIQMLDRENLMLKTALLYYEEEATQSEIAKKLIFFYQRFLQLQ